MASNMRRMRTAAVVLCFSVSLASEVNLMVTTPTTTLQSAAQVIFGNYPLASEFRAPGAFVETRVSSGCRGLTGDLLGKTAIVLNPKACDGRGGVTALLLLLLQHQNNNVAAVLASSDESGIVGATPGEPNWALKPPAEVPNQLKGHSGMAFSAPRTWVEMLAAQAPQTLRDARLRASVHSAPLVVGSAVEGSVLTGHIEYWSVDLGDDGDITVTVTPKFGNPDLHMKAAVGAVGIYPTPAPLPAQPGAVYASQTSPGDDVYNWRREDLPEGRVTAVIGIYGVDHSDYTLLVSSSEDAVALVSGEPKRFEVRRHAPYANAPDSPSATPCTRRTLAPTLALPHVSPRERRCRRARSATFSSMCLAPRLSALR